MLGYIIPAVPLTGLTDQTALSSQVSSCWNERKVYLIYKLLFKRKTSLLNFQNTFQKRVKFSWFPNYFSKEGKDYLIPKLLFKRKKSLLDFKTTFQKKEKFSWFPNYFSKERKVVLITKLLFKIIRYFGYPDMKNRESTRKYLEIPFRHLIRVMRRHDLTKNIARIANAFHCHSWLSGNEDCHEFRFSNCQNCN